MKKTVLVVLAVVMAWALASCGSTGASREPVEVVYQEIPYGELESAIANVQSEGQGFIVEAYFLGLAEILIDAYNPYKTVPGIAISDTKDGEEKKYRKHLNNELGFNYATPHQFEVYDSAQFIYRYIDKSKPYKMYVGVYRTGGSWVSFIDKIEGLPMKPVELVYQKIPYSELQNAIKNMQSEGQGFIVEAYVKDVGDEGLSLSNTQNGESTYYRSHKEEDKKNTAWFVTPLQFEVYSYEELKERIEKSKKYTFYIGVYRAFDPSSVKHDWFGYIDKIEGFGTKEEVEAAKKAEAEAEAAKKEAQFNPGKLDRSQYTKTTAGDFSFDMDAGKLPAGAKVTFETEFLTKPTGTKYMFRDINTLITFSTAHNFVADISREFRPERWFEKFNYGGSWIQYSVRIYVTIKKPGKLGECSVDIVEW